MATSFGIHVGNTSACIAVSKDGKTDVVASPTGDRVTPAVVSFTDTEVMVGLAAKHSRLRNLANTVTNNKRLLSGRVSQEEIDANSVSIVEENGKYLYRVDFKERELLTTPEEILTHIYRYVHSIADTHTTNVNDSNCVLSVPLDYSQEERLQVQACAQEAGFKVVQVISDPAAACLAYSLGQLDITEREHVLVYRAGGLSTDLSLVLVAGGCYSVLDSVSVAGLGGHQVTDVLVKFLASEFKAKYKEDILQHKKGRTKLASEAENVKHVLASLDTAHCYVESLYDGLDFSSNVTRARFDNQLSPVLTELLAPVSSLLTRAGLEATQINKVVMVGGSSKVVKLQTALAAMFSKAEVLSHLPPDEVLAYGAAVQASHVTKDLEVRPREKVLSLAETIMARVEAGDTVPLLVASTPLPVKRSVSLAVTGERLEVVLEWQASPPVILGQLSLSTRPDSKPSLSIHLHRDGSAHVVLQDKVSGESSSLSLAANDS